MERSKLVLTEWSWRLANSNGNNQADRIAEIKRWTPVTSSPSVVHMELLARNIIPDPNIGQNERHMQWAGMVDWEYSTSFASPSFTADVEGSQTHVDLVFEGLDTFATVKLNGVTILTSSNMFTPARVSVRDHLKATPGQQNMLEIYFRSAFKVGEELNDKYGTTFSRMRDSKRNHIRKAQVSFALPPPQPSQGAGC